MLNKEHFSLQHLDLTLFALFIMKLKKFMIMDILTEVCLLNLISIAHTKYVNIKKIYSIIDHQIARHLVQYSECL